MNSGEALPVAAIPRRCAVGGQHLLRHRAGHRDQEIADLDLLGEQQEFRQIGVEDHRPAVLEALLQTLEFGALAGAALAGKQAHATAVLPLDFVGDLLDGIAGSLAVDLRHVHRVTRFEHAVGERVVERLELFAGVRRQRHAAVSVGLALRRGPRGQESLPDTGSAAWSTLSTASLVQRGVSLSEVPVRLKGATKPSATALRKAPQVSEMDKEVYM
jgi:hypothetical protein